MLPEKRNKIVIIHLLYPTISLCEAKFPHYQPSDSLALQLPRPYKVSFDRMSLQSLLRSYGSYGLSKHPLYARGWIISPPWSHNIIPPLSYGATSIQQRNLQPLIALCNARFFSFSHPFQRLHWSQSLLYLVSRSPPKPKQKRNYYIRSFWFQSSFCQTWKLLKKSNFCGNR